MIDVHIPKESFNAFIAKVIWKSIIKSGLYFAELNFFSVTGVFYFITKVLGYSIKALTAR